MTLEDKIAEIIYQALYFQGTNLSNEVLDAKRNIARRTAKQILANPEIKEAFDYVKLYSEMGDKVDEFADRYEEFKAYKKSHKGIYVECPECTQKINDKISRFFRENCSTCKGTGKVQATDIDVKGMVNLINIARLAIQMGDLKGAECCLNEALTTPQGKLYL